MEEIFQKIKKFIADDASFYNQNKEVFLHSNFRDDLDFDSLDEIDLVMDCEREWNISIAEEEVEKMKTVQDLVDYIERNK